MTSSDQPKDSTDPTDLSRAQSALQRRTVLGGVALAALLGGAAASWLRYRTDTSTPVDLSALWDSSFESPSGELIQWSQFRARPLIVNFWATWCTPCIEEMPLIDRFYTENASKGWQVVGLAIDQPSKVRSFLAQHPVSYSVLLAGFGGTELAKALGNDAGALPYTLVLGADERVLFKKIGKLKQEELSSLT
jgi:thiol-disulfide isomerase/thioredoxin